MKVKKLSFLLLSFLIVSKLFAAVEFKGFSEKKETTLSENCIVREHKYIKVYYRFESPVSYYADSLKSTVWYQNDISVSAFYEAAPECKVVFEKARYNSKKKCWTVKYSLKVYEKGVFSVFHYGDSLYTISDNSVCAPLVSSSGIKKGGVYYGSPDLELCIKMEDVGNGGFEGCGIDSPDVSELKKYFVREYKNSYYYKIEEEGRKSFTVINRDKIGNTVSLPVEICVDKTLPVLNVSSSTESWTSENVIIEVSAEDELSGIDSSSFAYSINEGAAKKITDNHVEIDEEGIADCGITVSDMAGNSVKKRLTVKIDRTGPEFLISENSKDKWVKKAVINAVVSDYLSGVDTDSIEYRVGNEEWKKGSSIVIEKSINSTCVFRANDKAGNSSVSPEISVKVDTVSPVISYSQSIQRNNSMSPLFEDSLSGINVSTIKWQRNGIWTFGKTAALEEGMNYISWYCEDNAGNSVFSTFEVLVDSMPPVLSFDIPGITNKMFLEFINLEASDLLSDTVTLTYTIDNGIKLLLTHGTEISIAGFAEGNHQIEIFADDNHSNVCSRKRSFVIDRTPPEISNVILKSNDRFINNEDKIFKEEINGESMFVLHAEVFSEDAVWYSASLNGELYSESDQNEFVFSDKIIPGMNTVTFSCKDSADNISVSREFNFYVDNTVPIAPVIKSSTHKHSLSSSYAGKSSSPVFSISVFSLEDSKIYWSLYKCKKNSAGGIDRTSFSYVPGMKNIECVLSNNVIEMKPLEDNLKNEFYVLSAFSESYCGNRSEVTEYYFRIDTKSPDKFSLWLTPQSNEDFWYKEKTVTLNWTCGQDSTGVEYFSYAVDPSGGRVDKSKLQWKIISDIDAVSQNISCAGENKIYLRCYDNAGNYSECSAFVKIDSIIPYVSDENHSLCRGEWVLKNNKVALNKKGLGEIKVSWDNFEDDLSGVDSFKIVIFSLDGISDAKREFVLSSELNSYNVPGCNPELFYMVELHCLDAAGNSVQEKSLVPVYGYTGPAYIEGKFDYEFNGINISADALYNVYDSSIELKSPVIAVLPDGNSFYKDGKELKEFELIPESINFDCNRIISFESVKFSDVILRYGNEEFTISSICFDEKKGLSVKNAVQINSAENYPSVSLGFVGEYFASGKSSDCQDSVNVDGFEISNVNFVELSGFDKKYFGDCTVDLKNFNARELNNSTDVHITSATTGLSGKNLRCTVKNKIKYRPDDTLEYIVTKASIINRQLIIEEAYISLKTDDGEKRITVKGIKVNQDGSVDVSNALIDADSVIACSGFLINKDDIELDANGLLVAKGALASVYDGLGIVSGITFNTKDGILETNNSSFNPFEFTIFGFKAKSYSSTLIWFGENRAICVKDGSINIYGNEIKFSNLNLSLEFFDQVYNSVNCSANFSVNTGYGSLVTIYGIKISPQGIVSNLRIKLPFSETMAEFNDAIIFPDKKIDSKSNKKLTFNAGSFTLETTECSFDGNAFIVIAGNILCSGYGFYENGKSCNVAVNNSIFSWNRILESGNTEVENLEYIFEDWNFKINRLNLSEECINVSLDLQKQTSICSFHLLFEDGKIYSNRVPDFGYSSDVYNNSLVNYLGHEISVPSSYFEIKEQKNVLVCSWPQEKIQCGVDEMNFAFGKTEFYSSGNFVSIKSPCEVFIENPYGTLKSKFVELTKNGVMIEGHWSSEGEILSTDWSDVSFIIDSGFELSFSDVIKNRTFTLWGLEAGCEECFLSDSELKISNPYVLFEGIRLILPDFHYDWVSGKIKFSKKLEIGNLTLGNKLINIDAVEVCNEGINLGISCILPDFLGGKRITSTACINSDGINFDSDCVINEVISISESVEVKLFDFVFSKNGISLGGLIYHIKNGNENFEIDLGRFVLSDNGFLLEDNFISPFHLWSFVVCPEKISLSDKGISLKGYVVLSSDMPGILSGRTIEIKDFFIDWNGNFKSFEIYSDIQTSFNLTGVFNFWFNGFGIVLKNNSPVISFSKSEIQLPESLGNLRFSVKNIEYDIVKMDFCFDDITLDVQQPFDFCAIDFLMESLSFSCDKVLTFKTTAKFLNPVFPDFIRNSECKSVVWKITNDGSLAIEDFNISGLSGTLPDKEGIFDLKNGTVSVTSDAKGKFSLSAAGELYFNNRCPDGLQKVSLDLKKFIYSISDLKMNELEAAFNCTNAVILNTRFENLKAIVKWNDRKRNDIDFSGKIILPSCLPQEIAGTKIDLKKFSVNSKGEISSFAANLEIDRSIKFLTGVSLEKILLGISYSKEFIFETDATLVLDKTLFPKGFSGCKTKAKICFNTNGIKSVEGNFKMDEILLFDSLRVKKMNLSIIKKNNSDIIFAAKGSLILDNSQLFPSGLNGMVLSLDELKLDSSGKIISVSGKNFLPVFNLFNSIEFSESCISVSSVQDDLLFDVSSRVRFISSNMPSGLRETKLYIKKFEFSAKQGVKDFSIVTDGDIKFNIFSGLIVSANSLEISSQGITCSASAEINMKGPVPKTSFDITQLSLNWNGHVTDIQGGLGETVIDVAGFEGGIKALYFEKDSTSSCGYRISMKECYVNLPSNMVSSNIKKLSIEDAWYRDGKFMGKISTSEISLSLSGFKLLIKKPGLNFDKKQIDFSSVSLTCPDLLKKTVIEVKGVKITAENGLMFTGGRIFLPDFKIGESSKIGFRKTGINFVMKDNVFSADGSAYVQIPGCGEFGAEISFTEMSSVYPIGLKRCLFSYEVSGASVGIPLGTTGLFLTGIRGGIAYGEPEEVPGKIKNYMSDKMRLQLGVTVKDKTGGSLVKMTPDFWIDAFSLSMACQGNITVLSGTFNLKADAYAVLSRYGFSTQMDFNIRFAKGEVEFHVFEKSGEAKFSGSAKAKFGLSKGFLYEKTINLLFKKVKVAIPPADIWIGPLSADFGDFTNGNRGFKTSSSFPGFGEFGIFVGSSGIKLGNVSNYRILTPSDSFATGKNELNRSIIESNDRFLDVKTNTNRLIVICAYESRIPVVTVISPDGEVFVSEKLNPVFYDNYFTFTVDSPKEGIWNVFSDEENENMYSIEVVAMMNAPELKVTKSVVSGDTLFFEGTSNSECFVDLYAYSSFDSVLLFLGSCRSMNNFISAEFSTLGLYDGTYTLVYYIRDNDGNERKETTSISINVFHGDTLLKPVYNFRVSVDDTALLLKWQDDNGVCAAGYYLTIKNLTDGTEEEFDLGKVLSFTLHGLENNCTYSAGIAPYRFDGLRGESVFIDNICPGKMYSLINVPSISEKQIYKSFFAGTTEEFTIHVNAENYSGLSFEKNWFDSTILFSNYEGNYSVCEMPVPVLRNDAFVSEHGCDLSYSVFIPSETVPGIYQYSGIVFNEYTPGLKDTFTLTFEVLKLPPVIEKISEDEIDTSKENVLRIFGKGFYNDTKFFIDEIELNLVEDSFSSDFIKAVEIPVLNKKGKGILSAVNSNGTSSEILIDLQIPDFEFFCPHEEIFCDSFETIMIPVSVLRYCGFNEEPEFKITGNECFEYDEVKKIDDNNYILKIHCLKNLDLEAVKLILYWNEKSTNLFIRKELSQSTNVPVITGLFPDSVYEGQDFYITGTNFEKDMKVYSSGKLLEYIFMTENCLRVKSSGLKNSFVNIRNSYGLSNSVKLNVKNASSYLYLSRNEVSLDNQIEVVDIYSFGSNPGTDIIVNVPENAPFDYFLSSDCIKPGEKTELKFQKKDVDAEGRWDVEILGKYNGGVVKEVIQLKVSGKLEIDISGLGSCQSGNYYYYDFKTFPSVSNVTYIAEGILPEGVVLSKSGTLCGVPVIPGIYRFKIKAFVNGIERGEKKIVFEVLDEGWYVYDKDYSLNKNVSFDIPASGEKRNEYETGLINSFVLASSGVICSWSSDAIFVRGLGTNIHWNKKFDEKISIVHFDSGFICAHGQERKYRYNPVSGVLFDDKNCTYTQQGIIWTGKYIEKNGEKFFFDGLIKKVTEGINFTAVICQNKIVFFDDKMNRMGNIPLDADDVVLSQTEAIISSEETVFFVSLPNLEIISSINFESAIKKVAMASGKISVLTDSGLFVINQGSRDVIWKEDGIYLDMCLYDSKIILCDKEGTVTVFYGETNLEGPCSSILVYPEKPDGTFGWYKTIPSVSVICEDRDSFVQRLEIYHDKNQVDLSELVLHNGINSIKVSAWDTGNLSGPQVKKEIFVDVDIPESELILSSKENNYGWYDSKISAEIIASDSTSGISSIQCNGKEYKEKIKLDREGVYTLSWYSQDRAGNKEAEHQEIIKIDLYPPEIHADVLSESDCTTVRLRAKDSMSGLDKIYFCLDQGPICEWKDTIEINEFGSHTISFCASDKSGKMSPWKEIPFINSNSSSLRVFTSDGVGPVKLSSVKNMEKSSSILISAADYYCGNTVILLSELLNDRFYSNKNTDIQWYLKENDNMLKITDSFIFSEAEEDKKYIFECTVSSFSGELLFRGTIEVLVYGFNHFSDINQIRRIDYEIEKEKVSE